MTLEKAIDVFGEGFTTTRSFTHPYVYDRVGPLIVMRDQPRKTTDPRTEEYIAYRVPPETAVLTIKNQSPNRFALCVIHSPEESESELKAAYKGLGFRLVRREPMMVRRPQGISEPECGFVVRRIDSAEDADRVAKAARSRQALPEHLERGAKLQLYAAWDGDMPVGWVRSIATKHDAAWVSNMHVVESHRRRGIARALMSRMLAEDAERRIAWSVLLASMAGARLYPTVGYDQIGQLLLFAPRPSF